MGYQYERIVQDTQRPIKKTQIKQKIIPSIGFHMFILITGIHRKSSANAIAIVCLQIQRNKSPNPF